MRPIIVLLVCLGGFATAAQPAPDPTTHSAELIDVVQLPASAVMPPAARLNLLLPAPDESGRLFVNDMRGPLWILRGASVDAVPFLNVRAFLGAGLDTTSIQTGLSSFAFHPSYSVPGDPGEGKLYTVTSESLSTGTADFDNPFGANTHFSVLSEWEVDASNPDVIDTTPRGNRIL